jgi:hypothetical protein
LPEQAGEGPEDDTDWMANGSRELEAEMTRRQAELEAEEARRGRKKGKGASTAGRFDPEMMADRIKVTDPLLLYWN